MEPRVLVGGIGDPAIPMSGFLNPFGKDDLQEQTSGRMRETKALNWELIKVNHPMGTLPPKAHTTGPPFQSAFKGAGNPILFVSCISAALWILPNNI